MFVWLKLHINPVSLTKALKIHQWVKCSSINPHIIHQICINPQLKVVPCKHTLSSHISELFLVFMNQTEPL